MVSTICGMRTMTDMTNMNTPFRVIIISTGGTIEKTYCELGGVLSNQMNVLDVLLAQLELDGVEVSRRSLMNKDSLDMTDEDLESIVASVREALAEHDGVVVVHGTDRLADTGDLLCERLSSPGKPVVLTGAMRPFELRQTDAIQNITEALLAVQLLEPGIWCVMHNKAMRFPGVRKDRKRLTLVKD